LRNTAPERTIEFQLQPKTIKGRPQTQSYRKRGRKAQAQIVEEPTRTDLASALAAIGDDKAEGSEHTITARFMGTEPLFNTKG
jgi:hypothetical protein